MTATEIINEIEKRAKINLSTRERNWIKKNAIKRKLHISSHLFISWDEIRIYHTIMQNGKSRKPDKVDRSRFAIVVGDAGSCRILLP